MQNPGRLKKIIFVFFAMSVFAGLQPVFASDAMSLQEDMSNMANQPAGTADNSVQANDNSQDIVTDEDADEEVTDDDDEGEPDVVSGEED